MMNTFQEIDPKTLDANVFKLIGEQWMLVTAGKQDQFNMMTASWGGLGFFVESTGGLCIYSSAALYL